MPVQYSSIIEEHRTVRRRSGCSTCRTWASCTSWVRTPATALAAALVSDPASLAIGRAQYSMICAPDGGIIDDLIVYRLAETRFLVVANAGNAAIVSDTLAERLEGFKAVLDDRSLATGLLAVQGPRAVEVLGPLTDVDLPACATTPPPRAPSRASRTGRPDRLHRRGRLRAVHRPAATVALWDTLLEAVRAAGGLPVGLGARDTLRLEAGMPLYGNELDLDTNPYEAGLGRVVKLGKPGDFVGRARSRRWPATALPGVSSVSWSRAAGSRAMAIRSGRAIGAAVS